MWYSIIIMYIRTNMFRGDSYVKRNACKTYGATCNVRK